MTSTLVTDLECSECGLVEVPIKRYQLGYTTCLPCGERVARKHKHTIVPMHKSNYVVVSNRTELLGINNKGCAVK